MSAKFLFVLSLSSLPPCPCLCAAPKQQPPLPRCKSRRLQHLPLYWRRLSACLFFSNTRNPTRRLEALQDGHATVQTTSLQKKNGTFYPPTQSPLQLFWNTPRTSFALSPALSTITLPLFVYPCMPTLVSPRGHPALPNPRSHHTLIDDNTKVYPHFNPGWAHLFVDHTFFYIYFCRSAAAAVLLYLLSFSTPQTTLAFCCEPR